MSVPSFSPPIKSGPAMPCPVCSDHRIAAFARMIEASDRTDVKTTIIAIRELRSLGWSVCPVGTARKGGA